jgi:transposase-like protein
MARSTRRQTAVKEISAEQFAKLLGPHFQSAIRQGVCNYLSEIGLAIMQALMQGEVDYWCGKKYSRKTEDQPVRWGQQRGVVQVRDAKESVQRPRMRAKNGEGEIDLETYTAFSNGRVLSDRTLAFIGAGVPIRQYETLVSKDLRKHGVSASAVSRRVIVESKRALESFLARRWDNTKFVTLLFDGVRVGKAMVVACVGIDKSGTKYVLGWKLGSTENEIVCRDLIRQLIDAGLNKEADYLFVVDGAKALSAAIKAAFGSGVSIQRCQEHKIRDVEGYLPVKLRNVFRNKLHAAFNQRTHKSASDRLQAIRLELLNISEPAANSLTEGLEQTLTLHKLNIDGGVRESLRTTNIIESAFSSLRRHTRNVTAWGDSDQVNRWLATGLARAEKSFRRVPGYRQLAKLQRKLTEHTALQSTNC